MHKTHIPAIRAVLRKIPEGMTINQIRPHLPYIKKPNTIRKCLEKMPDSYVDRWVLNTGKRGQYEAVWCVVVPPENCPYPTDRFASKLTRWVGHERSANGI